MQSLSQRLSVFPLVAWNVGTAAVQDNGRISLLQGLVTDAAGNLLEIKISAV